MSLLETSPACTTSLSATCVKIPCRYSHSRYLTLRVKLPFGTTWQNLKDWIKPVCKVDHVEVFPTSTSGWVRLKGKSDFESAWRKYCCGVVLEDKLTEG